MNYDREVIDFHYHNILNGFSPFLTEGVVFLAKHICSRSIFEANTNNYLVRDRLKKDGIASEYEILKDAVEKGTWSAAREQELKGLQTMIDKKEALVPQLILPSHQKSIRSEIVALQRTLNEKTLEKQSLLSNSLEYKLLSEKRDYIAVINIYKTYTERLWANYDAFLEQDNEIANAFTSQYFKAINEITSDLIRNVAKMTDARYKLKNSLKQDAALISINYLELKQWCEFYNGIFDLADKPDISIIMDDSKLDGWIAGRKAKQQAQKSVNTNDSGYVGMFGANKEDMDILEGTDRDTLLKIVK